MQNKVSLPVIKRLPKYYRYLSDMHKNGVVKVSSSELAKIMGTTASQVRQDFNCFGGFGQQGIGYHVDVLLREITNLLFSEKKLDTILIGTGRLGRAISGYLTAEAKGYQLIAAFDKNPEEIGRQLSGVDILDIADLESFCKEHHPEVAVLCIPRQSAQELAPSLVALGIKGYWNFSHYDLSVVYDGITVENVHLGDSLISLGYRVRNN
ncbi:redox-sensing transcriptional repressor Rex [Ruthenibacterium sp. CLA-JM-H11]|uniref:Redox-sensing transcriptional repressor Rex n=1 Tax=Ruthenibacterium intestinale TaxID=3133163 RepID=A0ABV1GB30_9FIRM